MSKIFSSKKNRNNPFKYGGYSMAQSYKDKIAYKNKQLETKNKQWIF